MLVRAVSNKFVPFIQCISSDEDDYDQRYQGEAFEYRKKRTERETDAVIEEIKSFQPEWKRSGNGRLIKGGTIPLTQVVIDRVENNLVADASTPSQKKKLRNVVRKRARAAISSDSSPTLPCSKFKK